MIGTMHIPGEKWLYLRIYTGCKTADTILGKTLNPLTRKLISEGIARKWFFIRYSDSDFHLRYRVEFQNEESCAEFIPRLNAELKNYINDGLVWKLEIGSYQPETKRYGSETIELAEELFHQDTEAFLEFMDYENGIKDEDARWLYAMASIDSLLSDFNFQLNEKKDLLLHLSRIFGEEFGKDKHLAMQLSQKYRKHRDRINRLLNEKGGNNSVILNSLIKRSEMTRNTVNNILRMNTKDIMEPTLNDLLTSLIHMSLNRIFRNNNRLHEMVVYDLLFRYYKSKLYQKKGAKSH